MSTPPDRLKEADKKLKVALACCLILGPLILAFVLIVYYKNFLLHWDKPMPVGACNDFIDAARAVVFIILPALSVGYFVIAYIIWHYRRKRDIQAE
jgi:ABC-type dipeptide/oligopeptide/nickel transport system permease component